MACSQIGRNHRSDGAPTSVAANRVDAEVLAAAFVELKVATLVDIRAGPTIGIQGISRWTDTCLFLVEHCTSETALVATVTRRNWHACIFVVQLETIEAPTQVRARNIGASLRTIVGHLQTLIYVNAIV